MQTVYTDRITGTEHGLDVLRFVDIGGQNRQIRLPPRQNVSEFVKSLRGHCYHYPTG